MSSAATNNDRHENVFQSGRFSDPCYCLSTVEKKKKCLITRTSRTDKTTLTVAAPTASPISVLRVVGEGEGQGVGGSSAVCT